MEETRISRMYLTLVRRALGKGIENLFHGVWLRSSVTWIVLTVLLLVGAGLAIHEKGRGNLHRLKTQLGAQPAPADTPLPEPGGQPPIALTRDQQPGAVTPEFLSVTLLPGRGMNVLQITAFLPGKGVVSLLAAPSLEDAANAMTGSGDDANGQRSLIDGAAIEVPWAGRITGAVLPGGLALQTNWHGRGITLPVNWSAGTTQAADGGLLLRRGATLATPSVMPDGGVADATFDADDFDGHWPSKTRIKTTALLSARAIDLTVEATNTGVEPEPIGIGWRPRFAVVGGDRAQVSLRVPSSVLAETKDPRDGLPTGRLVPTTGTAYDFSEPGGIPLKTVSLNELYVRLKNGELSDGPEVELRDPTARYGLRMKMLSPEIKALRVVAPADAGYITLAPQTNLDDPFGREWSKDEDTGMVTLQPQQRLQWKVRLELFPITASSLEPRSTSRP